MTYVHQRIQLAPVSATLAEPGTLTDDQFAGVLADALLVLTYVPKLFAEKKIAGAIGVLGQVVEIYGDDALDYFKNVWESFKGKNSDDMARIWALAKEKFDLPAAYDEYEAKVERIAGLPIISSGQINDIIKLVDLVLGEVKGKTFFEAIAAVAGEFKELSAEFTDTLALVKEWIALIKELRGTPSPE